MAIFAIQNFSEGADLVIFFMSNLKLGRQIYRGTNYLINISLV